MIILIKEQDGFIICLDALHEEMSMWQHFVDECGMEVSEYEKMAKDNLCWFCAHVSIWKDAKQWADEYLGCCCYSSYSEFYLAEDGYFADMVKSLLNDAKLNYGKQVGVNT